MIIVAATTIIGQKNQKNFVNFARNHLTYVLNVFSVLGENASLFVLLPKSLVSFLHVLRRVIPRL